MTASLFLVSVIAAAAPQATIRHKTFEEFQAGRLENVAVLGTGALELGPRFQLWKGMAPEAFVWALAADSKGRVYAATGNSGTVFELVRGKARVALATGDLEVLSLAVDANDNVYAACAPSGKIYKIPPRGKSGLFCETGQTYVWALVVAAKGDIYAGTGPEGKVLKISPDGKNVRTVYDSKDKHILSLAAAGGAVYAGTSDNGLVYRISPDGKVSVAFDSIREEVRCMAADEQGNVYFGSADGIQPTATSVPRRTTTPTAPPPKGGGTARAVDVKKNSHTSKRPPTYVPTTRPGASRVSATNYVYRLSPSGRVTVLFRMSNVAFLSMAWHKGALYVGTAGEGKVFRIASERDVALIAQQDQPQVLSLCGLASGKLFIGTGNDGRVYAAESARATEGSYTSQVIGTGVRSSWGAFQLQGRLPKGTKVELSTRSGNSKDPDDTWSKWSKPQVIRTRAPMPSPPARFIQYRLALSTRDAKVTPSVRAISFPYLADNYPPSIDSIDVTAVVKSRSTSKEPPARSAPPTTKRGDACIAGTATVSWKASDLNRDSLEYGLYFRGTAEKSWRLLKGELTEATYTWDTEAVPDGTYELKVWASDRPDNPPPRTLTDELVSDPVTVDNSPPAVRILATKTDGGRCSVEAELKDAGSNIAKARYSVDAQKWQPLLPVDQIFDGPAEKVRLRTEKLEPGEHTLVIQAEDSSGNVGSAKTVFDIPAK